MRTKVLTLFIVPSLGVTPIEQQGPCCGVYKKSETPSAPLSRGRRSRSKAQQRPGSLGYCLPNEPCPPLANSLDDSSIRHLADKLLPFLQGEM